MVKQTFLNLSKERQNEILTIAYQEFALNNYNNASLSVIIKRCGLAKGSFYRYFANKKELYGYLIQHAKTKHLSRLNKEINTDTARNDLYKMIYNSYFEKIRYEFQNPIVGCFLYRTMVENEQSDAFEVVKKVKDQIIEQTEIMLQTKPFNSQHTISDYKLAAYQIYNIQIWLYDYLADKYSIDYNEHIKTLTPIHEISDYELKTEIKNTVLMLKYGLKKSKNYDI